MTTDTSKDIQDIILDAYHNTLNLNIVGGNSKRFYGNTSQGKELNVSANQGILNYEPTELVITARAGTLLGDIEKLLDENNQMFAFEPPHYSPQATLGGTIACNFSGPRRAYAGAARDFLLGCKIINGKGEVLSFGGEVMKNVAGYDASRLMCGALGSLGVILESSLKILPKPEAEISLVFESTIQDATKTMRSWAQKSLPISATCYHDGQLHVRLSSTENAIKATKQRLGGDEITNTKDFWNAIKEQQHAFFQSKLPLWRVSLDPTAPPLENHSGLYEWSGALRWYFSENDNDKIRRYAAEHGGHAILFRNKPASINVFQALPESLQSLHQNLKMAFDPKKLFNRNKLYSEF